MYGTGDRMLLPKLLAGLAEGKFMYIGDGSKQMNCVYVEDVAAAAVLAATTPGAAGQAYNITDGAQTTLREFISFITDRVGLPAPTRQVPPPIAVAGCYTAERVGRLLGLRQAPMMNISRLRFIYYNQLLFDREGAPRARLQPTGRLPRRADGDPGVVPRSRAAAAGLAMAGAYAG